MQLFVEFSLLFRSDPIQAELSYINKSGAFLKDTALKVQCETGSGFPIGAIMAFCSKIDDYSTKAIVGCIFLQSVRRFDVTSSRLVVQMFVDSEISKLHTKNFSDDDDDDLRFEKITIRTISPQITTRRRRRRKKRRSRKKKGKHETQITPCWFRPQLHRSHKTCPYYPS